MLAGLTGMHLLLVAAIVLVLFGATKLPVFAKSLGQTVKVLRTELHPESEPVPAPTAAENPAP
ncbi:Sec-independent protein translocase subunit TatA/TatB [Amnibacterium kyonggiense]